MVKSLENGTSLPPFLVKCYEMVSDESTDGLISWTESNDSFIIWDETEFSSRLLPKYFKHSNFSSFVRQLNIYGFRKVDTDRWQFANESFIKDQKHLLKNITRRKQPQNLLPKKSSQPKEDPPAVRTGEDKRTDLWKEVESLKTDKNALMQELKKLRQHQQMSQSKLQLLREQMKGMEKNQQQMLSFIVMAMQSPEFLVQFFQPKENNWRMATETGKSKLSEVADDGEPAPSDGMIVPYQPPKDGPSTTECAIEASDPDDFMELDFSSDQMRDLFVDIDFLLGPLDEKLLPLETQTQVVLPDIPETDTMLEQLLLSEPSDDDGELPELEAETCTDSRAQVGSTFHLREASSNSNGLDNDGNECVNQITEAMTTQSLCDDCEKGEVSTKQMGYLTSEMGLEH